MRLIFGIAVVVLLTGCAPKEASVEIPTPSEELSEYKKLQTPLPGRAIKPSLTEFLVYPERFHKKRIILEGHWKYHFESSLLYLDSDVQDFRIWVDWLPKPMMDEDPERCTELLQLMLDANWNVRVEGEGSFYFSEDPKYGHLGVAHAFFLIDRLFTAEPVPEN